MSEWKIEKYRTPSGEYIILHDIEHLEAGHVFGRPHYVWPHGYPISDIDSSYSDTYKFGHCMTCKQKAPDILLIQLRVLNAI